MSVIPRNIICILSVLVARGVSYEISAQPFLRNIDTNWYEQCNWIGNKQGSDSGNALRSIDSSYFRTIYYNNGKVRSAGNYIDAPGGLKTGHWVYYDSLGNKESEGNYQNDSKHGIWRFYYAGTNRLFCEQEYLLNRANGIYRDYDFKTGLLRFEGSMSNGERSGHCSQYYTGTFSLYRTGNYKYGLRNDTFLTYHRNGVLKRMDYYDWGKIREGGKCFDSLGRPVGYTQFLIDPIYTSDMDGLLTKVVYEKSKRGRKLFLDYTSFGFTISKSGEVSNLVWYCVECQNERHIRAFVTKLARWRLMLIDGYKVATRADCNIIVWEGGARIDLRYIPIEDFLNGL